VVGIAPEGTRSLSGQVLAFKKGPFHLWEHLRCPPIHPLLVMGAHELMPPPGMKKAKSGEATTSEESVSLLQQSAESQSKPSAPPPAPKILFATCGRVYVRFLQPITVDRVSAAAHTALPARLSQSGSVDQWELSAGDLRPSSSRDDLLKVGDNMSNVSSKSSMAFIGSPSSSGKQGRQDRAASGDMRGTASRLLREDILTALRDEYPSDAGAPLNWSEFTKHKVALLAALWVDYQVTSWGVSRLMIVFGLSWLGVLNYFVLFTVVVTAIVYMVKVKVPQYLY
jgi:hypothetical protein